MFKIDSKRNNNLQKLWVLRGNQGLKAIKHPRLLFQTKHQAILAAETDCISSINGMAYPMLVSTQITFTLCVDGSSIQVKLGCTEGSYADVLLAVSMAALAFDIFYEGTWTAFTFSFDG